MIRCGCGRFLGNAHARGSEEWGLSDVRGDCARCGPDVQAGKGEDAWWWSWDAWSWSE